MPAPAMMTCGDVFGIRTKPPNGIFCNGFLIVSRLSPAARRLGPTRVRNAHSPLMRPSLITTAQRAFSAFMKAAISAGVLPTASISPMSCRRF